MHQFQVQKNGVNLSTYAIRKGVKRKMVTRGACAGKIYAYF